MAELTVREALLKRQSTRAYLDKPVSRELIEQILDSARHAPSGTNTQPWQVAVVTGESKRKLCTSMEQAFHDNVKRKMDYNYYPLEWSEPYKGRRKECGLQMYSTLEIPRKDKQRQLDQWAANYRAFDAPAMLFFFIDRVMETGSFFDYGMFFQSVMLEAVSRGLSVCPQAALGEYPQIVREELNYGDNKILISGMAIGYGDESARVNSYRTSRLEVDEFTRFYE